MKLCYLENNIMYFTSDMDNQWGDDWDDHPYECNAVSHTMPCSFYLNSPYSAQDINNRIIPWEYTDEAGGLYGGDSMGKAIKWLRDNNFEWAVLHG